MNGWIHLSVGMFLIRCVMCRSAPPPTASEVRAPVSIMGPPKQLLSSLTLLYHPKVGTGQVPWAAWLGGAGQGHCAPHEGGEERVAARSSRGTEVEEQSIVDGGGFLCGRDISTRWVGSRFMRFVRSALPAPSRQGGGPTRLKQNNANLVIMEPCCLVWFVRDPAVWRDGQEDNPPAVEEENSTF